MKSLNNNLDVRSTINGVVLGLANILFAQPTLTPLT